MVGDTFIIGTKGIDDLERSVPNEMVWECDACGEQTCAVRGDKPTECTRVQNIPKSEWKEEQE